MLSLLSLPAIASDDQSMETIMKNMGFTYRQALQAEQPAEVAVYLTELKRLTLLADQGLFPEDKADIFRQGLQLVLAEIDAAKQAIAADNLAQMQTHLKNIDKLRIKYHKERRKSFWQILFGG